MAATRRDVFKTSVVSAFGLMAGGSVVHAADFSTTRVIVRATQNGMDYDLLIDASGEAKMVYILDKPYYGAIPGGIGTGTLNPAKGIYYIVNLSAVNPQPSLKCDQNGNLLHFNDVGSNTWNEIGQRAKECPPKAADKKRQRHP
ncbi:MAG: hypothetical protein ACJ8IR_05860 [Alphaproteobacteria bacterium]|jgi:hypothetical protein